MIKIGRYDQISREDRICPTSGSNQIEDGIHFLFGYPKYSTLREEFYRKIKHHPLSIKQLSLIEANTESMNFPNHFVGIQMLKFILSCLDFCNNLLSIQKDVT